MPRYVVERSFPAGLTIPIDERGEKACFAVIANNGEEGVTWIHSYVSDDKRRSLCVYDAPSPEAIRRTAARNRLGRRHHAGPRPRPLFLPLTESHAPDPVRGRRLDRRLRLPR